MTRRRFGLVPLLVGGVVAVLLWLLFADTSRPTVQPVVRAEEIADPTSASELHDVSRAFESRVAAGPDDAVAEDEGHEEAELEPGDLSVRAASSGSDVVIVRLQLRMADGSPFAFEGHDVETQSWLEDSEETFRHLVQADEDGVATFEFPGYVHVDWFRYEPPPGSGLAFALDEHHSNLEPGSVVDALMEVGPGATLFGRVEHADGRPAAGIEVHAFINYYEATLDEAWRPGIALAVSETGGDFRFPNLPARDWSIAVPPFEWVQLSPDITDPGDRGHYELEVGEEVDAGIFRIAPLERLSVTVLDENGAAVPEMLVELEPLEFASPALLPGQEPRDDFERWLGGEAVSHRGPELGRDSTTWDYGTLSAGTDEKGRADLLAVAGRWEIAVSPSFASRVRDEELHRELVSLPPWSLTLRIPLATRNLAGVVVDQHGMPIADATVRITQDMEKWGASKTTEADGRGRFRFEGLPARGSYRLRVEHRTTLPCSATVDFPWPEEPVHLTARRGESLRIQTVKPDGERRPRVNLTLFSGSVDRTTPPLTAEEAAYVDGLLESSPRYRTGRDGVLQIDQLPPGTYELGIRMPVATGGWNSRGLPVTEMRVLQSWSLETREEPHVLTVDLSGYTRPPRRQVVNLSGVVRDAVTGDPLVGALVRIRSSQGGRSGNTVTNEDGQFQLRLPPGEAAGSVLKDGFVPTRVPTAFYEVGEAYQELYLQPGSRDVHLTIEDANGESLPTLLFTLHDAEKRPVHFLQDGQSSSWRTAGHAIDGEVVLAGLSPGCLTLGLELFGSDLGGHEIEVLDVAGTQELRLTLEETQDGLREKVAQELAAKRD